ncbi:ankyrin repeat domain-containing protein [Gordonia paraffinivorans]|uniref:ankyrin repeat domain-containing protein n=1 Tax=Gordonia paraffinivorans TaxID=175628 RepID=UPI001444DC84
MAGLVHVVVALCEVVVSGFGMRGAHRHTLVDTPRFVAAVGHSNTIRMNRPSGEATDGADVNAREARGWTPLHFAAQQTHVEVAEKLINAGAVVEPRRDPLGIAAPKGGRPVADDVVRVLRSAGADRTNLICTATAALNVKDSQQGLPGDGGGSQTFSEVRGSATRTLAPGSPTRTRTWNA